MLRMWMNSKYLFSYQLLLIEETMIERQFSFAVQFIFFVMLGIFLLVHIVTVGMMIRGTFTVSGRHKEVRSM